MSTQHIDWQSAHQQLSRVAKDRARLDCEEGDALLQAFRAHVHLHLGFASFAEYVERLLAYTPRWTQERLRVAEALETLPRMQCALRDGSIPWSTARELSRVATPQSEQAWLDVAHAKTIRQVEQLVAGHAPGDLPGDSSRSFPGRHVLRVEVSAETLATFREAMTKLRRQSDGPLDDDTTLLLMARQVLGGPGDPGRANYQVAMTVCRECHRGWQQGRGEQIEVDSKIVEMASCDAQHIGPVADRAHVGPQVAADSAHVGIQVAADRAHVGPQVAADRAHVGPQASAQVGHQHVPERTRAGRGERARAHQDIPPAVRREVRRRDGGRCVVPGCRHATFLDLHHLVPRSEGGDHDTDTLVTLCAAHHRAQHRGQLVIEGKVSTELTVRHADGSSYGTVVSPLTADIHAQVFRALRSLGFREREARAGLAQVRAHAHSAPPVFQTTLRAALAVLSDRSSPQVRGRTRTSVSEPSSDGAMTR